MLLKIELNNGAQCKNAIMFHFLVTISIFSVYQLPHSFYDHPYHPDILCLVLPGTRFEAFGS